jgi:hypothetical protein
MRILVGWAAKHNYSGERRNFMHTMKSLQEVLISADCSIRCFLDPVSDAGD